MCKSDVAYQLENCGNAAADVATVLAEPLAPLIAPLLPAITNPIVTFDAISVGAGNTITATITWPVAETYQYDFLLTTVAPAGTGGALPDPADSIFYQYVGAGLFQYSADAHEYIMSANTGISTLGVMMTLADTRYLNIIYNGVVVSSQLLTWV